MFAKCAWLAAALLVLGFAGATEETGAVEQLSSPRDVPLGWTTPAKPGHPEWSEDDYQHLSDMFERNADSWSGAFVDGDVLVVATVLPLGEAQRALSELDLRGIVEVRRVVRSMADLDELTALALARLEDVVVQAGPQYASNRVMLGVTDWSTELEVKLADLPSDAFGVYRIDRAEAASRYFATPPMSGGSALIFRSTIFTKNCSSGFGWSNANGYPIRLLSAGHCARTAALVWNDVEVPTSSTAPSSLGTVIWTSVDANGTSSGLRGDLAGIRLNSGTQSAARIWVGQYNTSNSRSIIGRRALPENWTFSNVFTSGAAGFVGSGSGERQLTQVLAVNQSLNYANSGQVMTNLTTMIGVGCVASGDSGGAVYQVTSSGAAWAIGVISGVAYSAWGCASAYTPVGFAAADWEGDVLQ